MKNTKKTRRVAAFAAAVMMAACVAVPMSSFSASAVATVGKISFTGVTTSSGTATHTYAAYMIFSGTAVENGFGGTAELKDTQWAMDATKAADFLSALKTDTRFNTDDKNDFADCTTAAAVAKVLTGYAADSVKAKAFADFAIEQKTNLKVVGSGTVIDALEDGYYVIEETAVTNGTMTAHLLGVYDASAGAEITVKSELPTFQKKIKDTNDSNPDNDTSGINDNSTNGVWQDSADYDIGDAVPFQLTATLPDDYATYKQYKLVFHDNLQDSVYGDAQNIKVYYQKGTDAPVEITGFTSTTPNADDSSFADTHEDKTCNLEVTIANLKTATGDVKLEAGDKVIVEYTAELKTTAKLGEAGNWNSGYLEYSNNPYYTGDGTDETTSKTPEDMVVAFTYQLSVDKVDNAGNALEGAGFTLYKYNGEDYVAVGEEITGVTTFEFKGVDAGQYKLVETTIPAGYNPVNALEFIVKAKHVEEADTPTLTDLTVVDLDGNSLTATDLTAGKFVVTKSSGLAATKIINNSGATLPSTGGIGTTLFYVGGGVLVAGAGVLLITKKRAKKDAE